MTNPCFVHLHIHTEFSLQDSIIRIPEKPEHADPKKAPQDNLLSKAVELGLPAIAVTDINNVFALIKFYKAAYQVGIKPIVGADVLVHTPEKPLWPITLLCRNRAGYLSLSQLLTRAWMHGHRSDGQVAVNYEWVKEHASDLCALIGGQSNVAHLLTHASTPESDDTLAKKELLYWQSVFGDALHLEITRTNRAYEEPFNTFAIHAAGTMGLPIIATNDVRFLAPKDYAAHEARVCIATGRVLDDPKRPRTYSAQQYLRSGAEMAELFADVPDAVSNTVALAERCTIEFQFGTYHLPAYPVPKQHTLDSWMRTQATTNLEKRLQNVELAPGKTADDYRERLKFELDTIIAMGFSGYFLIVADFISWGKQQGIPIGPGRGSGAGSLVAWALEITDLDPLPYNLLFERFLNPERVSMPDFDIDFCMEGRDRVIDYVAQKYGRDRVSQIITYGTMAAKAVVRDTGRVLGFSYGFVDSVAKLIPNTLGITLDAALSGEKDSTLSSNDLLQRYKTDEEVRELIDLARQLENLTRNAGKHAGGVVIAPEPLSMFCPLFAEHDTNENGKNPVTQFDKNDVETIGLVKFDFLGLRTLTIIDCAVKDINQNHIGQGAPLQIASIPLDDAQTYREIFASGNSGAVFQFESPGMRRLLKDARPDRFEDLIALVSLYRPGPMDLIPSFVNRKHGKEDVIYPDERVEHILKDTYGIMVYQEQVMQMAQIVGGYSLGAADLLRRAMGKKVPAEMAKHRAIFREGASKGGVDPHKAEAIFDQMEKFAGYGFNKSHAAAYALVSYQTAWLKCHYPSAFMAATLSSDMDNTDKVVGFLEEVEQLGITLCPPHVNHSAYRFRAIDSKQIDYGLGAIKGVGEAICSAIYNERTLHGQYTSLLDLCLRLGEVKLHRRALEPMICAGALDGLGKNRASMIAELTQVFKISESISHERKGGQTRLFVQHTPSHRNTQEIEKSLLLKELPEWPLSKLLAAEHAALGISLSGHPFDPYRALLLPLISADLSQLLRLIQSDEKNTYSLKDGKKNRQSDQLHVFAGIVTQIRRKKDGQTFLQLEDGKGRLQCGLFADATPLNAQPIRTGDAYLVKGTVREDDFNGGYSMRIRQYCDFASVCAHHAKRIMLQVDLRIPDAWQRLKALLASQARGDTALFVGMILAHEDGAVCGTLEFAKEDHLSLSPSFLETLHQDPAVYNLKVEYGALWT